MKRQSNICTNLFFKVVNVREGEVTDSVVLKHLLDHLKFINYKNITDVYNVIYNRLKNIRGNEERQKERRFDLEILTCRKI